MLNYVFVGREDPWQRKTKLLCQGWYLPDAMTHEFPNARSAMGAEHQPRDDKTSEDRCKVWLTGHFWAISSRRARC